MRRTQKSGCLEHLNFKPQRLQLLENIIHVGRELSHVTKFGLEVALKGYKCNRRYNIFSLLFLENEFF